MRANFSTPRLVVPGAPEGVSKKEAFLLNDDLKPVPPALRTWSAFSYANFWVADGFNLSSMMIASTAIVAGLSWWQAWLAVWVAYVISACAIVLQSRIAAAHHIGFPPIVRSSFGIFGSIWPVLNRTVVACIWFSVQSWIGGQCMGLVLRSWSPSWADPSPALSGTSRNEFVSFFIFWLIQFPITWVSPQKVRHLFTAKAVCMPIAAFGLFGWTVGRSGGLGPVVHLPARESGSVLGWAFVVAVMSQCSNMVTLCVNAPDFARMARKQSNVLWPQLIAIPMTFAITSLIGILISSSSEVIFGKQTWNPLDILAGFLDQAPHDPSTRAGVFFIASGFILAQIGTNVAANSLSCGSDLTALLPRYVSIKRGQILCALFALCMCPWYYASSSGGFTNYLSAYSVLLSPILGVMLSDSYLVRRGHIDIPSLYSASRDSYARYNKYGVNWRAYAAYLVGCALNMPGFVSAVSEHKVPMGLVRVYQLAFLTGSLTSALVYALLTETSPVEGAISLRTSGWKLRLPVHDGIDYDGTSFTPDAMQSTHVLESGDAEKGSMASDHKSKPDIAVTEL